MTTNVRAQAHAAAEDVLERLLEDDPTALERLPGLTADAVSDVWEPLTATARLREAGIDLERLTRVIDGGENWGHLVHAFEVLAVLGAVKNEMEALGDSSCSG